MKNPKARNSRKTHFILHLGRRVKENRGQSLLEMALVLPMLFVLLVGGAEFGRLAYGAIEAANAARAGVAYGAQGSTTAADITGMETAATNDGRDITTWATMGLSATASESCICSDGTSITCSSTTACIAPAHVIQNVQVNTTATVDPLFRLPGLPTSYTLHAHATMRVQ